MKMSRGHSSQTSLTEGLNVVQSRFALSRWEKLLAANLLVAAQEFYSDSKAYVEEQHCRPEPGAKSEVSCDVYDPAQDSELASVVCLAPRAYNTVKQHMFKIEDDVSRISWQMHFIKGDATNCTATKGLKAHVVTVA